MSNKSSFTLNLPDWYLVERETQKTIMQLSGLKELEFYFKHPDEYIRHQAILRLGQLSKKDSIPVLTRIIDDPLEIPINREIAAWVLKSFGSEDYFIGNEFLDRFTGNEKLKDFYYPVFLDDSAKPDYHFGESGIEALLSEETMLIKAESFDDKVDLPFSLKQWLISYTKCQCQSLGVGLRGLVNQGVQLLKAINLKNIIHKNTTHKNSRSKTVQPLHQAFETDVSGNEKQATTGLQCASRTSEQKTVAALKHASGMGEQRIDTASQLASGASVQKTDTPSQLTPGNSAQTIDTVSQLDSGTNENQVSKIIIVDPEFTEEIHLPSPAPLKTTEKEVRPCEAKENAPVDNKRLLTKESGPIIDKAIAGYYTKPFTLKSNPEAEPIGRRHKSKGKIYVRSNPWKMSFGDRLKGLFKKILRIVLLPFVILWNQKVAFVIVLACLYLFFTFVPYGRMLFYGKYPELAKINEGAVHFANEWISQKITDVKEKALDYQLVREFQKKLAADEKEISAPSETIERYIVAVQTLNLRKTPGTSGEKLLLLVQNEVVEFMNERYHTEQDGTWFYIKASDGTTGWSYANYLRKLEAGMEAYEGK